MNTINTTSPITTSVLNKNQYINEKIEVKELTRSEIISSKAFSMEQKLEKLGITAMSATELANGMADKIMDTEI